MNTSARKRLQCVRLGTSDCERAVDLVSKLNSSAEATSAYLHWLEIVVRDTLAGSWELVEEVAGALMTRRTLTAAELLRTSRKITATVPLAVPR